MTRTKRFVTEPSRSPLQSRAGVLLNLIFPDLRRPAASSKRNQGTARSSTAAASASQSGTPGPGAAGQQQQDKEESTGGARSCSPTLAGCDSSQQQQLPSSLLHLASLDADDIGGLSDLLDDDEPDQLTLVAGQPAAAGTAGPGSQHAAASASRTAAAVQQQQPETALHDSSPGPAAAAAEQHASVDGKAYIVEHSAPVAAAAAAAPAPEDADGFTAVDKMLEQLSVDVMLDQQYLLEEQQRKQQQQPAAATAAASGSAVYHASSSGLPAGMAYPTGPAAALTPPAAAAAVRPAGVPMTLSGSHQVPVSITMQQQQQQQAAEAEGRNVYQPAIKMEGQQQQQQQQQQQDPTLGRQPGTIPQAWQLHPSFSAPLLPTRAGTDSATGQQTQYMTSNTLQDSSSRPFSFQDLLLSDEPAASSVTTSIGPGYDNQLQQQQQQPWASCHLSQAPQLHSTHSAPLPVGAPPLQHHHQNTHPAYGPASFPNIHQQQQQQQMQMQHGMHPRPLAFRPSSQPPITFYHQHHQQHPQHPQQQMYPGQQGSSFPGQPGTGLSHTASPHQAELEALKQQIAEEKRRRKERKQLKKMRKIMQQQQQQQQHGVAQQVLYAASSQQQLPPPPPGTHAAGTWPRPRGLPHPPWPPAAPQQQQQRRYPGTQRDAAGPQPNTSAGPYGAPYHVNSVGRGRVSSPQGAAAAAAAAARQHAVAQSLRQLAHKSEQMHRAGSGHAPAAVAPREVPPPSDRHILTQPCVGVRGGGGSSAGGGSSRYGSYSNNGRPPVPQSMNETDAYMRSSNSSGMSAKQAVRSAASPQGQLPAAAGAVVLDLQHSDPQSHHRSQRYHQQPSSSNARLESVPRSNSGAGEFRPGSLSAPDAAADDAPAGNASWMHGNAAAATTGSNPPVGRSLMGLDLRSDLRSAESAIPLRAAAQQKDFTDAALRPSSSDVLAAAGAAAPHGVMSADTMCHNARMQDAPYQQQSAGDIGTPLGHAAAGNAAAAAVGEAIAAASPVSTTSSSGRKRSWQQAAAAADATMSSGRHQGHDGVLHPSFGRIGSSGGLQAMSCDQPEQQQHPQQPQQRQQRLLQLPFNGPDLAERRPLVTTEPPVITKAAHHHQLMPEAAARQIGASTDTAAAAAPADLGVATAAAAAGDQPAAAAAASVPCIGSPDINSMCTSSDNAFQRPKPIDMRAAKAPRSADSASASSSSRARAEAAGRTSPGLSSGPSRQQSFSEATAAAAAAAAAAVGGSGGSGDLSGYLGGFGSPGVYRTSSGKVLRMLTHPVTGKPLLLGPAVDAKSSRLGNTSLGAPAPQLFGMDLQSTHLNSMPTPYPHTPGLQGPAGYAPQPPPAAAAAGYAPAGFAAAAVPGMGSPTISSTHGRQRLYRGSSGLGSPDGVGSAGMSGVEVVGLNSDSGGVAGIPGGYGLPHASSGYSALQFQPGLDGYAGMGIAAGRYEFGEGMTNATMHAGAASAMWGQQSPLLQQRQQQQQQQQQPGFADDGLASFEQLQQFNLQPVQCGGAAPMDSTPGAPQGMVTQTGLCFE